MNRSTWKSGDVAESAVGMIVAYTYSSLDITIVLLFPLDAITILLYICISFSFLGHSFGAVPFLRWFIYRTILVQDSNANIIDKKRKVFTKKDINCYDKIGEING